MHVVSYVPGPTSALTIDETGYARLLLFLFRVMLNGSRVNHEKSK